jgi:hypothetical protein
VSAGRDLCIMACVFCRDPLFLRWLASLDGTGAEYDDEAAKTFIIFACGVTSRSDLDTDPTAAARFHELVRVPFLTWKEAQVEHSH